MNDFMTTNSCSTGRFKKAFIELDDDEDNDKPDLYKEIIKRFHVDRLTWKDLFFNDFEMHFYRYVFPYYDTLYTLEKLSQKGFQIGVIANGKSKIKQFRFTFTWFDACY